MAVSDRKILEDYIDRRIKLNGMITKLSYNKPPGEPFQVALLEDIWVDLSGVRHFIGHAWLQHAETLKAVPMGERVECSVTVKHYHKRSAGTGERTEIDYSLRYPNEVRIVSSPPIFTSGMQLPSNRTTVLANGHTAKAIVDPVKIIMDAKAASDKVGGWKAVEQLNILVTNIGGFEALDRLRKDAEGVGGWTKFMQILEVLNPK